MTAPIYAIGYARVSTKKQADQGESLNIQADFIASFVGRNSWTLFPDNTVLEEAFTGGTDHRPVYELALTLIRQNPGKVKYFVVRTIDRFSREGSFKYQQMKAELAALGVELRDIGGTIQPTTNSLEQFGISYPWSAVRPSAISEVVLAETASYEKSAILTRLIGSQIRLTQQGYCFRRAANGYRYHRQIIDGKKRSILVPDEDRAPFIRKIFEMRADDGYSDAEIVGKVNAMGYTTRATNRWDHTEGLVAGHSGGRPLTVKAMQRLIMRPIYCGISCGKWTHHQPVRAKCSEPLVSIDLFNRANRGKVYIEAGPAGALVFLYDRKPVRLRIRRERFSRRWPYKHVVACPRCRKPLHASASRGKSGTYFAAYHCARTHTRYSMPQPKMDSAVRAFLSTLRLSKPFWEDFQELYTGVFNDAKTGWTETQAAVARNVESKQRRLTEIAEAFLAATSDAMRSELDRKAQATAAEKEQARANETSLPPAEERLTAFLSYARQLFEHPLRLLDRISTYEEQRTAFGLIFEELPTYQEIHFGTPKLRPTFEVARRIAAGESLQADLTVLDWNTVEDEVTRWEEACWALRHLESRKDLSELE